MGSSRQDQRHHQLHDIKIALALNDAVLFGQVDELLQR
jgi:hypothetical protein